MTIRTYMGHMFDPLSPTPGEIDIHDIAHSLSMQCRYNGHTRVFYSVAEHCCIMADLATTREDALWALLHDATEAYLTDLPAPIKRQLPGYQVAETSLMVNICHKFGLKPIMPATVKELDQRILANEMAALMHGCNRLPFEPLPNVNFFYWSPEQAEQGFLDRFHKLKNRTLSVEAVQEILVRYKDKSADKIVTDAYKNGYGSALFTSAYALRNEIHNLSDDIEGVIE